MDTFRSAIRPAVTLAFVTAFLLYAHFDTVAFNSIKDTAIVIVAYWFGTRQATA